MFLFVVKRGRKKYVPATLESGDMLIYDEKKHVLTAKRPKQGTLLWYRPCDVSEKFTIPIESRFVRPTIELISSSLHLSFREEPQTEENKRTFVLMN